MNLAGLNIDLGQAVSGLGTLAKSIREAITGEAILDPNKKAELLMKAQELESALETTRMSIMVAEASSTDKWTSRARPGFLYLFYVVILALTIIAPIIGVFSPFAMSTFYTNVKFGFEAVPTEMWWTFTTGYLGYTAARQYGKTKGSDK